MKKPTCIFTNDAKLGQLLVAVGGKCRCKGNHGATVRDDGNDINFAALPMELCKIISSHVQSKTTQLKFDKMIADNQRYSDGYEAENAEASEDEASDSSSET